MNAFADSIKGALRGGTKSFRSFPAVMVAATLFVIVTVLRIETNNPEAEFLLTCLQWGLAFGALFSMAVITAVQTRLETRSAFLSANVTGLAAAAVASTLLYLLGGRPDPFTATIALAPLAAGRMAAACAVSLIAFIIFAARTSEGSDTARSFFMTQRAFFIALVYGLVIGGGTSAVAAAVQGLLYPEMSNNVYAYLSLLAGYVAFAIFVGYFPDFRRNVQDPRRKEIEEQPRFIQILCEYILIPILLAFTLVLLAWVVRILFSGDAPQFVILSGSVTTYAVSGIWLHVMVTHYPGKLPRFYRLVFPMALVGIIGFAMIAVFRELGRIGLRDDSYRFLLIMIFAAGSAILLLIRRRLAHSAIFVLGAALLVIAVLPIIGQQELPVRVQASRLEQTLEDEGILADGRLQPAAEAPDAETRAVISEQVNFLAYSDRQYLPPWFVPDLAIPSVFHQRLGFEMTGFDGRPQPGERETILMRPQDALDITGYSWAVTFEPNFGFDPPSEVLTETVSGERGEYRIEWSLPESGAPVLKLYLNDEILIDADLSSYVDQLIAEFPLGSGPDVTPTLEQMSYKEETDEAAVLLVFNGISMNEDRGATGSGVWFSLELLLLQEK